MTDARRTSASSGYIRTAKIVGITLAVTIVLILAHPWLFGLPGRVQEWRFQLGLHKGITRAQVLHLASATGNAASTEPNGNVDIVGWDFGTVCIASGKERIAQFDDAGRAALWNVTAHGDGC